MTVPTRTYTWEQGTDLEMKFIYRTGENAESMAPVDLTDYAVRMDIRATSVTGDLVYTFNSTDIEDVDPVTEGDQADTTKEAVLGVDGSIRITVPRSLTLPGGAIYEKMTATPPVTVFVYDIILRDGDGKQSKLLSGTISVNASATLWT
jgi:hypothetical protein